MKKTVIKVLGSGCPTCKKLFSSVSESVKEMKLDADVVKVEDMSEILSYKIRATPAIVINEKVVIAGRLPQKNELEKILKDSINDK
jgi:small redox-active disulfide protein 2